MRVEKQTLEKWREAISRLDTPELREQYKNGQFDRADKVKDLDIRYAHDLFWAALRYGFITYDELSDYNRTNIATALRQIVPRLDTDECGTRASV